MQQTPQSDLLPVDYFSFLKLKGYISKLETGHGKQTDGPEGN